MKFVHNSVKKIIGKGKKMMVMLSVFCFSNDVSKVFFTKGIKSWDCVGDLTLYQTDPSLKDHAKWSIFLFPQCFISFQRRIL